MKKKILSIVLAIIVSCSMAVPMTVLADEQEYGMGYIPVEDEIPEVHFDEEESTAFAAEGISREGAITPPVAYRSDVRIGLPALRNQGQYETCWAFSALGACEASLISKGLADASIDLSEAHLSYFFYNKGAAVGDSHGNTVGDYNRTASKTWATLGGNSQFTIWHLASWAGPVSESNPVYAYSNMSNIEAQATNDTESVYGSDVAHLQNCIMVPLTYRDDVKRAIMEQGSVGASYHAPTSSTEKKAYDSGAAGIDTGDEGSFYCPDFKSTNHAIQIVGWDDDYDAAKFVSNPGSNGAWLVKNSWGEESNTYAQNGYFWMSYQDKSLSGTFVYDCETADNYDNIYQYDGASYSASVSIAQAANVFVASDDSAAVEKLDAVSIGIAEGDVNYTVDIYTYPSGTVASSTAGTKVHSQTGYIKYPGYHTIPLNKSVKLEHGQKFGVVFRFGKNTKVYIDYSAAAKGSDGKVWAVFMTEQAVGQSFAKTLTSAEADMALQNPARTLRIKAFTNTMENAGIWFSQDTLSMQAGDSYQLSVLPSGTVVTWTSSDEAVATVANGLVKALKKGTAVITAVDASGNKAVSTVTVGGTSVTTPTSPASTPDITTPVITPPGKGSITKVAKTSKGVKITFKKIKDVTGYDIYRSKKKSSKGSKIATVKGKNTYTDKKVKNKKGTYYYRVRAYRTVNGVKKYGSFSGVKKINVK